MAIKSALRPESIVRRNPINSQSAQNFISGGAPLGSSVVSSAANKIVGFQRAAVKPVTQSRVLAQKLQDQQQVQDV